ncbi:MAG: type II toxin-antitoxin system ParD family antitoxin [Gammaproteobacteria bacterium]|nr:MAG: type II toxin-antitoxin system ParD family antitoxin [Gammaproteobacteria bacterium]PIE37141.1 MAG: type II toxin-antitoxin system ParD family antitoxin [Gammaproteobacteria bacterium]
MPSQHARNVALTPELSEFVDELVDSGEYANASEVLRAGLRTLKDRRILDQITKRLCVALDELDRGEGIRGDPRDVLAGVLSAARDRPSR